MTQNEGIRRYLTQGTEECRTSLDEEDEWMKRRNRIKEIQVSLLSDGPLNDGIQLLRDTPLSLYTRNFTSTWKGQGKMVSRTDLVIPMGVNSREVKVETLFHTYEISHPLIYVKHGIMINIQSELLKT